MIIWNVLLPVFLLVCLQRLQVSLAIESVNSYIAWDFSLVQGKMNLVRSKPFPPFSFDVHWYFFLIDGKF